MFAGKNVMTSRQISLVASIAAIMISASVAMGAPRGGGHPGSIPMRGGAPTFYRGGAGTWSGGHRWGGGSWSGRNWQHWGGDWHHHHHHGADVIFIGDFGFPWWWGWGWYPWWGWGYPYWGYPYYGYYNYAYPYYGDYDQYANSSRSRVAELQRRLARAGYYHGSIDGIMGPKTRRAIREYERDHGYTG
jgi:hypothetical protein